MTNPAGAGHPRLDMIRKLLAKAENPACTPAEADALNAKANELIAKYGVDMALLTASDPRVDAVGDRVIEIDAPYARAKGLLLIRVGLALRCRVVQRTNAVIPDDSPLKFHVAPYSIHLFGFGADLDRVEMLYTSLLIQAHRSLANERIPFGEGPVAFRNSWWNGFSAMVWTRLKDAEQRAERNATNEQAAAKDSGPSVALVFVDRSKQVDDAASLVYPAAKTSRRPKFSGSGGHAGVEAGKRADIGTTRLGGTASTTAIGA